MCEGRLCDDVHRGHFRSSSTQHQTELWTKDEAEFHGEFIHFPPVKSFGKCCPKLSAHSGQLAQPLCMDA